MTVAAEPASVSVVLASRDRQEQLVTTLRALAAQGFPAGRMEVVLVLDGATDGSAEAVRALETPWALRVEEQPGQGLAVARNRGIALARNDLLVIWDDDIVPERDLVAAHAAAHAAPGEDAIVMGVHPMVADPASASACSCAPGGPTTSGASWRRAGSPRSWTTATATPRCRAGWPSASGRSTSPSPAAGARTGSSPCARCQAGVPFRMRADARGTHYPRVSFAGGLRNARQEGRYDVLLARAHPDAAGRLPLGELAQPPDGARERLLRDLAAPVPDGAWIAAASAAERARA